MERDGCLSVLLVERVHNCTACPVNNQPSSPANKYPGGVTEPLKTPVGVAEQPRARGPPRLMYSLPVLYTDTVKLKPQCETPRTGHTARFIYPLLYTVHYKAVRYGLAITVPVSQSGTYKCIEQIKTKQIRLKRAAVMIHQGRCGTRSRESAPTRRRAARRCARAARRACPVRRQ